jgi:hypothetical protein
MKLCVVCCIPVTITSNVYTVDVGVVNSTGTVYQCY